MSSKAMSAVACLVVFLASGLCAPAAHAEGVLYAPANPDNPSFRAALAALINAPVDYWDAYSGGTPPLSIMLDYDCVFTHVNYPYANPVAMGNALADYVDLGGQVILGSWCYPHGQSNYLQGRIMTAAYCPAVVGDIGGSYNHDGTDCVHWGVTSYTAYEAVLALQPGAGCDGTVGSEGKSAVAWRGDRLVYCSCGNTGSTSGSWAQLTANMVLCPGPLTGDINCDGAVNAFDIDAFVVVLTWPAGGPPPEVWPHCESDFATSRSLADCNGDGVVNAFDIDPFVALLVGAP